MIKKSYTKSFSDRDRSYSLASFSLFLVFLCSAILWNTGSLEAGGNVEIIDISDQPSPVEGNLVADIVGVQWNRCVPVPFRINDTLDPIPNPIGEDFLTLAEATATFEAAAEAWNEIPTSFMELRLDGTITNTEPSGIDLVNEITFRTGPFFANTVPGVHFSIDFGAIAYSALTILIAEFDLPDGTDLDGDGDVDITADLEFCADLDGDGDVEFPADVYPAGSLFDVDLIFSTGESAATPAPTGFRFTTRAEDADDDPRSIDLYGMAVQAFGLGHGLSHSLINQVSNTDGLGSPLFPYTDTADPEVELSLRTLDIDAIATSSRIYPEGSATSGPASLGPGDVAFDRAFGVISGEVRFGTRDEPLLGANVFAVDRATGRIVATAISGTSRYSVVPDGSTATFLDADFHAIDGRYQLVVPPGVYTVGVEPIDGTPVDHQSFNLQVFLHNFIDQDDFSEDFYSGPLESAAESFPAFALPVSVRAGRVHDGVDIVTDRITRLEPFADFDALGTPDAAPGVYYAVRILRSDVLDPKSGSEEGIRIHNAEFLTGSTRTSQVPRFAEAFLTWGTVRVDGSATVETRRPFLRQRPFVGQDFDFTPLWPKSSRNLTRRVERHLERNPDADLFLVLRLATPQTGSALIGLDGGPGNDDPILGHSFISTDGSTFLPSTSYNFLFRLVLGEAHP